MLGLLLVVVVTAANRQDRDGAYLVLTRLQAAFPLVGKVWADGGYAGKLVEWTRKTLGIALDIVKRTADMVGFVVLHRRWVVERTFGWFMHHRRLV